MNARVSTRVVRVFFWHVFMILIQNNEISVCFVYDGRVLNRVVVESERSKLRDCTFLYDRLIELLRTCCESQRFA